MHKLLIILLFLVVKFWSSLDATTHWKVNYENKKIQPQFTSPFYLKQPSNLMAFLNQSDFKKRIDEIVHEFTVIKEEVLKHMNELDTITTDLSSKTSCILNYYLDESEFFSTTLTHTYWNRLMPGGLREPTSGEKSSNKAVSPKCSNVLDLDFSMYFDHLESIRNRKSVKMEPEEIIWQGIGLSASTFARMLHNNLKQNPTSWRWHSLGSIYWRYKGNAAEAIECARRGIALASRQNKDIPLLSLGVILQRSKNYNDSFVVINAALDHEPNVAENQIAMGNALFLLSEFNKSMECYETARSLDPIYYDKVEYIQKSMKCFRELKVTLQQMEALLEKIEPELQRSSALKKEFQENHELMSKEQAPISSRIYDDENDLIPLLQRSQICTTRYDKLKDGDNAGLYVFCDFMSDLHDDEWPLEDFGSDMIHRYVALRELINTYRINSLGIYKKISIENLDLSTFAFTQEIKK
ncbi:tetratricopeptide repeat protein 17 [Culicoides brevitarsis]|uniref:tetratricopeptide repeat protein 17 n=1 Tax=Culicoides brevitarsis TaxID=469753 RepID=UPI00307BE9A3